jgi:hypothetical protein
MTPGTKVNVHTYRDDRLYPRVAQAVEALLAKGNVVAPVDVLVRMKLLKPKSLMEWRRGRVPYLEKVIDCNLNCLSKLLPILRFCAHDMKRPEVIFLAGLPDVAESRPHARINSQ